VQQKAEPSYSSVAGILPQDILSFWFKETRPEAWFQPDPAFDEKIRERFSGLYDALRRKLPEDWLATPRGRLAAILVFDQFPRNMFRGKAEAFATDNAALALAKDGVGKGDDRALGAVERQFFYLPFEHSERREDQVQSLSLYEALGGDGLEWARRHKAVIDRFGRFPARNTALGRETTAQEEAFLAANPHGF
jgi:uncharacterized protein (DUF924 family)